MCDAQNHRREAAEGGPEDPAQNRSVHAGEEVTQGQRKSSKEREGSKIPTFMQSWGPVVVQWG